MREGEELVEAPFGRLIQVDQLMAFRHEDFCRSMDTLKDKQILEDLVEKGKMPWLLDLTSRVASVDAERKIGRSSLSLQVRASAPNPELIADGSSMTI